MGFAMMLSAAFWSVVLGFVLCGIYVAARFVVKKADAMSHVPLGAFFFVGSILAYWLAAS